MKTKVLVTLLATPLLACQSEVERLQGETVFYLQRVIQILEAHTGRTDEAIAELDRFFREYGERIRETNAKGRRLTEKMSQAEKEAFRKRFSERIRPLKERIETLVRTYPDPPRLLVRLADLWR